MNTKELGNLGEKIACEYLVNNGFKILCKNYRISFGEIDIIAKKKFRLFIKNDRVIHFVEVKTIISSDDSFLPENRVDYRKQRKLRQMAEIWLEKNKLPQNNPYQIDIIGISIDQEFKKQNVRYFPNAISDI